MRKIPNELFFSRVEAEIAGGRPVRFRLKGWSMFPLLRDRKSTRLNSSHIEESRMPSSA